MLDYRAIALAGADLLDLVDDDEKRQVLDAFLVQQAPLVELAMREQIEELVDDIGSQVSERYHVRLVHEDCADFVEVTPRGGEFWDADAEERQAIAEALLPPEEDTDDG